MSNKGEKSVLLYQDEDFQIFTHDEAIEILGLYSCITELEYNVVFE